jgi:Protein of unknown function (DUF732)
MTLMLDPEPTLAADTIEDETRSIHAWSQEDAATEVVDYRPRSWRLPVTLAIAAAVGMIGAAAYLEWPASTPQPVAVAPHVQASPPVKPLTPDQRFLNLIQQRGVKLVSPPAAIKGAHDVCRLEAEGHNANEIAQAFVNVTPGADIKTEGIFVMTAEEVYCR